MVERLGREVAQFELKRQQTTQREATCLMGVLAHTSSVAFFLFQFRKLFLTLCKWAQRMAIRRCMKFVSARS